MISKNFLLTYSLIVWMGIFFATPLNLLALETTSLKIALYPYIPDADKLFLELEQAFEAGHPGVDVQSIENHPDSNLDKPVSLASDYYSGGLLQTQADVYEIDTVLLQAMIKAKKIEPIELPNRPFLPETYKAITFEGNTWGAPHWVCGNFLFYKKGDLAIKNASNISELIKAFKKDDLLLIDLKGKSTLGEWYLTGLAANDGNRASLLKRIQSNKIDQPAFNVIKDLLSLCPTTYCRNNALHKRVDYYAKKFAQGKARAYIGYSESLHYALQEIRQNCSPADNCLKEEEIEVREIPTANEKGNQVGWTDVLALSSGLTTEKKKLAMEFIEFLTSWKAYRLVLNPERTSTPRYLLPALPLSKESPELEPPLYPMFYDAYQSRVILNSKNLNQNLRNYGKKLDCLLPRDRLDSTECGDFANASNMR